MKKVLSMIMASAILTSSLSMTNAFAEDTNTIPEGYDGYTKTDIDVPVGAEMEGNKGEEKTKIGKYGDADEIEQNVVDVIEKKSTPKIYVEVEWDQLTFTYDFGTVKDYEWDIDELKYKPVYDYVNGESEGWNKDNAAITFTNYSNRGVYTGVSFEKNSETEVYKNVGVAFDKDEVWLDTAVGGKTTSAEITMFVSGKPDDSIDRTNAPELGKLKFYISEETRLAPPEEKPAEEPATESGEHVHHYVYDQFGRLVCTGCNEVKHEYCIDEDEDGLCDECGIERDFCPDCHIGGTCKCT